MTPERHRAHTMSRCRCEFFFASNKAHHSFAFVFCRDARLHANAPKRILNRKTHVTAHNLPLRLKPTMCSFGVCVLCVSNAICVCDFAEPCSQLNGRVLALKTNRVPIFIAFVAATRIYHNFLSDRNRRT